MRIRGLQQPQSPSDYGPPGPPLISAEEAIAQQAEEGGCRELLPVMKAPDEPPMVTKYKAQYAVSRRFCNGWWSPWCLLECVGPSAVQLG